MAFSTLKDVDWFFFYNSHIYISISFIIVIIFFSLLFFEFSRPGYPD